MLYVEACYDGIIKIGSIYFRKDSADLTFTENSLKNPGGTAVLKRQIRFFVLKWEIVRRGFMGDFHMNIIRPYRTIPHAAG